MLFTIQLIIITVQIVSRNSIQTTIPFQSNWRLHNNLHLNAFTYLLSRSWLLIIDDVISDHSSIILQKPFLKYRTRTIAATIGDMVKIAFANAITSCSMCFPRYDAIPLYIDVIYYWHIFLECTRWIESNAIVSIRFRKEISILLIYILSLHHFNSATSIQQNQCQVLGIGKNSMTNLPEMYVNLVSIYYICIGGLSNPGHCNTMIRIIKGQ